MFLHALAPFFLANRIISLFIGSFFFGEVSIIGASFLAGQGKVSLFEIFFIGFLATLCFDFLIFIIVHKFCELPSYLRYKKKHAEAFETAKATTGKNPLSMLLYSKFLYGTRILSIALLVDQNTSFSRFVIADLLGTFLWLTSSIALGYFAGKGIHGLQMLSRNIELLFTGIFLLFIAFRILRHHRNKKR